MEFRKLHLDHRVTERTIAVEHIVNRVVRGYDHAKSRLHLRGRKADYDDRAFEFRGGAQEGLRKKHYDKSMRLLWKAQQQTPWLSFQDATESERQAADQQLVAMATESMTEQERQAHARLSLPEYKELLNREYTVREKEAIVAILAAIGHGEAYAWLVSAALLAEVKSTGARTALTMQVLEEAKHFVVLRELLKAFDVPIRRQSAWEYLLLEGVYKADGLEKFFGMNVLVEGIALSFFGLMCEMPGLEVLRLFHLDEARHTALPGNYLKEFPLTWWQQRNPVAQARRLRLILPALALIPSLEADLAELGIDAFNFGGSVVRKIAILAERNGFHIGLKKERLFPLLNGVFNAYTRATRPDYEYQDYLSAECTSDLRASQVEREIFDTGFTLAREPSIAAPP